MRQQKLLQIKQSLHRQRQLEAAAAAAAATSQQQQQQQESQFKNTVRSKSTSKGPDFSDPKSPAKLDDQQKLAYIEDKNAPRRENHNLKSQSYHH